MSGGVPDGIDRRTYVKGAALLGSVGVAGLSGYAERDQQWSNTLEVMHGWTGGDGAEAIDALVSAFQDEYPDMETNFRAIGGTGNVNLD